MRHAESNGAIVLPATVRVTIGVNMPRRAYSVRYRVTISMDYQPGEFECEVLAKSKETAILMVGREMSNQNIPITEGAKVLLVQILGDY